ncbi:MAG TPA: TetR/AcrR family transcriptional regulator [Nitrolancea sp.]|nr:TetR/AcrR family transcriptional regulator [Nitrolancea sp.]
MPAREDRTGERRAQILQAAAAVYARQGIDGARMDDIVVESGLSKGTLYWYFDSKDDITIALVDEMINGEFEQLRQLLDAEGTVIERLERFFDMHAAILQANPLLGKLGIEFYAIAGKIDKVHELVRRYYDEFVAVLLALLKQGEERGELRVERPRELAVNLVALIEGSTLLWVLDIQEIDLSQQFRNAIALLFDGLRA